MRGCTWQDRCCAEPPDTDNSEGCTHDAQQDWTDTANMPDVRPTTGAQQKNKQDTQRQESAPPIGRPREAASEAPRALYCDKNIGVADDSKERRTSI